MTSAPVQWEYLTSGSGRPKQVGAARRTLIALAIVVVGHVLLLTPWRWEPRLRPPPVSSSEVGITVTMVPAFAQVGGGATPAAKPASASPQSSPSQEAATDQTDAKIVEPPVPLKMTPVSLTAEPVALFPAAAPAQAAPAGAAADAASQACDLTAVIQTAVRASESALDELAHVPRTRRSVANAIMLWDGGWAKVDAPGYAGPADPLQRTIMAAVLAAPATCRAQAVVGPRLLSIADRQGTTIIAIGSGFWRWGDLLQDAGA